MFVFREFLLKASFSSKVRVKTWRKLSSLLRHNVQELQALSMLRDRAAAKKDPITDKLFGGQPVAVVLTHVIDHIHKGQPLDIALYQWVPHEEVMLIRSGKRTASLPEALIDCVELIQAKQRIHGAVLRAVGYPLVLIALFVVLLLVISLYMVPAISMMSDPASWTGSAATLYTISNFVASGFGILVLVFIVAAAIGVFATLPYWTGPLRVKADNYPPWSVYRLIVGSVWIFTVVTLLKAKISLEFILSDSISSGVMQPWLQERVERIRNLYNQDANFGTLLLNLKMNFPDKEMVEELSVYASMPDFYMQMYDIAKGFLSDGIERVEMFGKAVNAILLMLIIAAMCGVGLAMGSINQQFSAVGIM